MKSKKILVTISDAPFGESSIKEKLRTALGVSAGYREHRVDVLFTGDSVLAVHIPGNNYSIKKLLKTFTLLGSNLYVDEKSIRERKINPDEIKEPFKICTRDEIIDFFELSHITISL